MVNRIDHQPTNTEFATPKENNVRPVERKQEQLPQKNKTTEETKTTEEILPLKDAESMVESMNQILKTVDSKLKFVLHDRLDKYYVTVIDNETDEVIREIPSKKLMDISAAFKEFVGLLVDRKI